MLVGCSGCSRGQNHSVESAENIKEFITPKPKKENVSDNQITHGIYFFPGHRPIDLRENRRYLCKNIRHINYIPYHSWSYPRRFFSSPAKEHHKPGLDNLPPHHLEGS